MDVFQFWYLSNLEYFRAFAKIVCVWTCGGDCLATGSGRRTKVIFFFGHLFNRPSVAGAVLKTTLLLIKRGSNHSASPLLKLGNFA